MRSWLNTRDVQKMLGGISQQRVSQLVREGVLVAERDINGTLQYDREAAERLAAKRARRFAESAEDADSREALQLEARDRFRRQREKAEAAERARIAHLDQLAERRTVALEEIVKCLSRLSSK